MLKKDIMIWLKLHIRNKDADDQITLLPQSSHAVWKHVSILHSVVLKTVVIDIRIILVTQTWTARDGKLDQYSYIVFLLDAKFKQIAHTKILTLFTLLVLFTPYFISRILWNSPFELHGDNTAYGLWTTWGWVNNDRILIFLWTVELNLWLRETSNLWVWPAPASQYWCCRCCQGISCERSGNLAGSESCNCYWGRWSPYTLLNIQSRFILRNEIPSDHFI